LVAAIPLFIRSISGVRVAEFIGSRESALADLLLAPGESSSIAKQLAQRITASKVDLVDVFGLPRESRLGGALGSTLQHIERVEAPVLDLDGGWDATYRKRLGSKSRNLHRRRKKQLAALGRLEFDVARTRSQLEPALEDALRLHAMRWSGRPDHSTFGTAAGAAFHRAAFGRLADQDVARIMTMTLDGRAIAFHSYFVLCDRMYVHRLAFDPALSRFSPGLVCTLAAIESAAAEGVRRVEFLGGAERYKLELADRLEPLHQSLGLATGARGRILLALRLSAIRTQLRLKRSPAFYRFYYETLGAVRRAAAALRKESRTSDELTTEVAD
jgi:CelD/BcsL family acetyltransferase involved in cellulose biosynthesis